MSKPFRPNLEPKDGYVEVLLDADSMLHGYCRVEDGRLFYANMEPVDSYTPAEERECAYETLPIIPFDGKMLTVDEAGTMFWHYYPDNSQQDVADELRNLISEAKDKIREIYPDKEIEDGTDDLHAMG